MVKICLLCGKEFSAPTQRVRYCGKECATNAQRARARENFRKRFAADPEAIRIKGREARERKRAKEAQLMYMGNEEKINYYHERAKEMHMDYGTYVGLYVECINSRISIGFPEWVRIVTRG